MRKMCQVFEMCCCSRTLAHCDSDAQIGTKETEKCCCFKATITRTYALTLSLNTHTPRHMDTLRDNHLTFQGSPSSPSLPFWLSHHLPPHLMLRVLDLKHSPYAGVRHGRAGGGGRSEERERERKGECVKKHTLSAERHLEV